MRIALVVSADNEREIVSALWGLLAINLHQMGVGHWPDVYSIGARYQRETPGREVWQTASALRASRVGDCEDLASYQVAYLRTSGIDPRATVGLKRSSVGWHVIVMRGSGLIEDPSAVLGM